MGIRADDGGVGTFLSKMPCLPQEAPLTSYSTKEEPPQDPHHVRHLAIQPLPLQHMVGTQVHSVGLNYNVQPVKSVFNLNRVNSLLKQYFHFIFNDLYMGVGM